MVASPDPTKVILTDYIPSLTEQNPRSLGRHVREELDALAVAINNLNAACGQVADFAPDVPQIGMIRWADGTDWDPDTSGLGGFFGYDGTDWVLLGR